MMKTAVLPTDSLAKNPQTFAPDLIYVNLGNLVLALILVGYPFSASITQILGSGSSEINIAFRAIHILLSLSLFAMSFARKHFVLDRLVILFFAIYAIRLWWDLSYSALPDIARDFQFFIAVTVVPVMAMAGSTQWYSERLCIYYTTFIGGLAGVFIAYNLASGPILALEPEINQRATLELLNPISIGYHGLFIALAAIILLLRYRTLKATILAIPIGILGMYLLIVSASRGPFVALLAGLVVIGLASKRANGVYAVAAAIIIALVSIFGLPEVISNRFIEVGQDESSLQRIYTLELAIEHASQNPLFGYAYIEPITARYPHNLIAEAGMALGLIGLVMVGWMQISLLFNAWKAARDNQWFIPFIAGAMFANAWISGSLWGSALFFATLWLVRDQKRVSTIHPNFYKA
jgi:O-antigen ligase